MASDDRHSPAPSGIDALWIRPVSDADHAGLPGPGAAPAAPAAPSAAPATPGPPPDAAGPTPVGATAAGVPGPPPRPPDVAPATAPPAGPPPGGSAPRRMPLVPPVVRRPTFDVAARTAPVPGAAPRTPPAPDARPPGPSPATGAAPAPASVSPAGPSAAPAAGPVRAPLPPPPSAPPTNGQGRGPLVPAPAPSRPAPVGPAAWLGGRPAAAFTSAPVLEPPLAPPPVPSVRPGANGSGGPATAAGPGARSPLRPGPAAPAVDDGPRLPGAVLAPVASPPAAAPPAAAPGTWVVTATNGAGTPPTATAVLERPVVAPPAAAVEAPPGPDIDTLPTEVPVSIPLRRPTGRWILEWALVILVAVGVAVVVRTYVVQTFYIPSASMEPTLMVGDRILVDKLSYHLHAVHRGDIVVFAKPPNEQAAPDVKDLVKRVIGLPGEHISSQGGQVYINGKPLKEPWLVPGTVTTGIEPQTIPPNEFFVMGDNRSDSQDSRFFGPISRSLIVGRVVVRIWPLSAFHIF